MPFDNTQQKLISDISLNETEIFIKSDNFDTLKHNSPDMIDGSFDYNWVIFFLKMLFPVCVGLVLSIFVIIGVVAMVLI